MIAQHYAGEVGLLSMPDHRPPQLTLKQYVDSGLIPRRHDARVCSHLQFLLVVRIRDSPSLIWHHNPPTAFLDDYRYQVWPLITRGHQRIQPPLKYPTSVATMSAPPQSPLSGVCNRYLGTGLSSMHDGEDTPG